MHQVKTSYPILLIVIGILSGCKVAPPIKTPDADPIPTSYRVHSDTTSSSGAIAWQDFFKDPYLLNLINVGISNNLDLKIALQRIEQANAYVRVSRGAFFPTLSAVTTVGQRKFGEYTMDGVGNYDTNFSQNITEEKHIPEHLPDYLIGLQSNWEIDLWGKLRNQKKAAVTRFLATEKARHLIITNLVAEIGRAYYELLALDNELMIIRENIALQQTAVDLIHIQKAAGRATELAVKQFTAQLLNTRSMEARIMQRIVTTENGINLLLGRFSQPIERGSPILQQALPEEIKAGVPAMLLTRRPDIAQAELRLHAAEFNVAAARAAFFPSLVISSSLGVQSFRPEKLFATPGSIAYSVFGGLTAPLFNRNILRADYQRASAEQLEMFYEYHKLIITGYQETITGLMRIENLQAEAGYIQQEVEILREAVSTSNDLYLSGMASYLEVIMAQQSVRDAELQLAETRKGQFFAVVDLYKALGGGWQ